MRIDTLHPDDPLRELPPVEFCGDVISAFHEIGRVSSNGMGATPITWGEINAYFESALVDLRGWAARELRKMSCTYCTWLGRGSGFIAPYSRELTPEEEIARNKRIEEEADRGMNAYNDSLPAHKKPR